MTEYNDDGLPTHVPIGINEAGDGPVDEKDPDYHRTICWCINGENCEKYKDAND